MKSHKSKISIIGKGTAGAITTLFFAQQKEWFHNNIEIEWYFDSSIPTQAVGEGSDLLFSHFLSEIADFSHHDLENLDGSFKTGIYKPNWNPDESSFFHNFIPPKLAYHINALKLQDYIFNKVKNKVKIINKNITSNEIDSDYIIDCSGKPSHIDDNEFYTSSYIPVNAVHVTQCMWEYPRFQYTIAEAMPHGWVFLIPLKNRCSVGYLYNHNISNLNEISNDVQNIFDKYNLQPSEKINNFHFNNYYRKQNFQNNICYNGNASFFLEPLEATSISSIIKNTFSAYNIIIDRMNNNTANSLYYSNMKKCENVIMLHYLAGSKYKTPFWSFAEERAIKCMEEASKDFDFVKMCNLSYDIKDRYHLAKTIERIKPEDYGPWYLGSFFENINGLGIKNKLYDIINYDKKIPPWLLS